MTFKEHKLESKFIVSRNSNVKGLCIFAQRSRWKDGKING